MLLNSNKKIMLHFNIIPYCFSKATWNMAMLQSEDILKAVQAGMTNEEATFSKL